MNTEQKKTSRQKRYDKMKAETPEGFPAPAARLKFPIIPKHIEYLDVIKNKVTVKSYKSEIAGLTWREVNEQLFKDGVPPGKYAYGMKFLKNPDIYRGFIKSVNANGDRVPEGESKGLIDIKNTIDELKQSLRSSTGHSIGIEQILTATQRAHDAEISIYKMENNNLKEKITELKKEISDLDTELDKAEQIIAQFKEGNSSNKITETILGLLGNLGNNKNQTLNPIKEKA